MTIQEVIQKCNGNYSLDNIKRIYKENLESIYYQRPDIINKLSKNFYKYIMKEYSIEDIKRDLPEYIKYKNKEYHLHITELPVQNKKSLIGGYKNDNGYIFYCIEEPPNMFNLYNKIMNELKINNY